MNRSKLTNLPALILCITAVVLATSGCVSSRTHKEMQANKDKEIATLQQEKTTLQQEKATLEQQRGELQKQTASIEQQKSELQQQTATLEQQRAFLQELTISLDRDKKALEAAAKQRQAQHDALVGELAAEIQTGDLKVQQYQNMLTVDVAEQLFFDSGHANIKSSGKVVLKKVGDVLKGFDNKLIWVVGHTDNVPIGKALRGTFPSNWELSAARATNVVRALQDVGVAPERMVSSGRSQYHPVAPNDTAEGRQSNRRIEIMLIDATLVEEMLRPKK